MKSHRIAETVIRVNERMSYTDVNDIVTNHKKKPASDTRNLCRCLSQ
ncbi:MAG: hypothetical protein ACLSD6_03300 [Clostridium sp.]